MKLVYKILEYIKKSLYKINLIDKCLIIFMMILMGQSIYNLFVNEANLNGGATIDILIRTTEASVFGYFLSANCIKKDRVFKGNSNSKKEESIRDDENKDITRRMIDDNSENAVDSINDNTKNANNYVQSKQDKYTSNYKNNNYDEDSTTEQQIIIVTVIGIISLISIIMARDFNIDTTVSSATISQLRDFVSGSVGFLLGCPTKTNK